MKTDREEGVPPPSKKSKKVDCGGWNHPDSEKNTRATVYGQIGLICSDKKGEKDVYGEYYETGSGFDDDGPGHLDDEEEYKYADPYVCWNKHLYKAYVGWNLVAAYIFSTGFFWAKARITAAIKEQKPAPDWWNGANALVQTTCLVEGIVSYYILTSKTTGPIGNSDKCNFFILATMPLSKSVAFPAVQVAGAIHRNWEDWDRKKEHYDSYNNGCLHLLKPFFLAFFLFFFFLFLSIQLDFTLFSCRS